MESLVSEKVQHLTRILSEEAEKFPGISVGPYSSGIYRYDWTVYQDQQQQLGTISFTSELALSERELRSAFRHELRALTRSLAIPAHAAAQEQ
jgi:hypothetical protein